MPSRDSAVEVSEFRAPQPFCEWRQNHALPYRTTRQSCSRLTAACMAIAVHVLLAIAWLKNADLIDVPTLDESLAGSRGSGGTTTVTTLFFIWLPPDGEESIAPAVSTDSLLRALPSLELPPLPIVDLAEATMELGSAPSRSASLAEGESEFERLRAIYVNQLEARLARVWQEDLSDPSFASDAGECAIRVTQTQTGEPIAIEYQHCDEGKGWRESIVAAIRRAAPLPAPPSPTLFSPAVNFIVRSSGQHPVSATLPPSDVGSSTTGSR